MKLLLATVTLALTLVVSFNPFFVMNITKPTPIVRTYKVPPSPIKKYPHHEARWFKVNEWEEVYMASNIMVARIFTRLRGWYWVVYTDHDANKGNDYYHGRTISKEAARKQAEYKMTGLYWM